MPMKRLGYTPKEVKHGSGLCTYNYLNPGTLNGSFGQQAVTCPVTLGDGDDFASFHTSFTTTADDGGPGVVTAQRYFLKDMSIEMRIVNSYDVPCTLTIYECLHRKDQYNEDYFYPDQCWEQGYVQDDDSGVAMTTSFPGSTPYDSTVFTTNFKVISTEKKMMQAGQVWCYRRYLPIHAYWDIADAQSTRGWSYFTRTYMFVLHGHIDRQATVLTPGGQAGISASEIDWVTTTKFNAYPVQTQRRVHFGQNNLITVGLTSEAAVDPNLGIARVPFPATNAAATGIKDNAQSIPVNTFAE